VKWFKVQKGIHFFTLKRFEFLKAFDKKNLKFKSLTPKGPNVRTTDKPGLVSVT
jgi:hypothetical protein